MSNRRELVLLADKLDRSGFEKDAKIVDEAIEKYAIEEENQNSAYQQQNRDTWNEYPSASSHQGYWYTAWNSRNYAQLLQSAQNYWYYSR